MQGNNMPDRPIKPPAGYDGKMEAMAERLGVSVVEDRAKLGLTTADVERLMRRCTQCFEPDACVKFLKSAPLDSLPPEYCVNRKLLFYLKSKSE